MKSCDKKSVCACIRFFDAKILNIRYVHFADRQLTSPVEKTFFCRSDVPAVQVIIDIAGHAERGKFADDFAVFYKESEMHGAGVIAA